MSDFGKTKIFNGLLAIAQTFFVGPVTTSFGAAFGRPNKILVAFGDWATVHFRHCHVATHFCEMFQWMMLYQI
jgi:hypothetical protein